MTDRQENIVTPFAAAIRLLDQGQYQAALTAFQHLEQGPAEDEAIVLWKMRCLFEQGRLQEAVTMLQEALKQALPYSTIVKIRLWLAFLTLYRVVPDTSGNPFMIFETVASAAATDPQANASVQALVAELRSQVTRWRVDLGWEPPQTRLQVIGQMMQAVRAYEQIEDWRAALRTKLRLAECARHRPYGKREHAIAWLEEVCTDAATRGYLTLEADAQLALAELAFDSLLATTAQTGDLQPWIDRFEYVAALYRQAGHVFGDAKVMWSWAYLLLQYGDSAGVTIARDVVQQLAQHGEVTLQQHIWKVLGTWYTGHGEAAQAREAMQQSAALSARMAFPLAFGVDQLSTVEQAFRDGRYGEGETLSRAILQNEDLRDIHVATQLMLANGIAHAGRHTQACTLFDQLIARLEHQGGSLWLADAVISRANLDSTSEIARQYFDRLLQRDQAEENLVAFGQHLMQRAWMKCDQRRRTGLTPLLTPEIDADFDRAQTSLAACTTLEARMYLGQLLGHRGRVAFLDKRWEQCASYLSQAEAWCRVLELRPTLAFTLTQQGLALIELGRMHGLAYYERARTCLEEAETLFTHAEIHSVLWHVVFAQAVCDQEGGLYWESPGSVAQGQRWTRAQHLLLRVSAMIDTQRGTFAQDTAVGAQMVGMAFGSDKQQVYTAGFQLAWNLQQNYCAALQWLERMKGRALLDALAATVPVLPTPLPDSHPLIVADIALRQQKRAATDMNTVITLQRAIDQGLQQMISVPETAGYAALRRPEPPAWEHVRTVLNAEQQRLAGRQYVIAQFYHTPQHTLLFGLRADWDAPRLVQVPVAYQDLRQFVAMWFQAPSGVRRLKNLGPTGQQQWQQYATLIAPLAEWTTPGDVICLIPHADLHDIPLHTLCLNGVPLAERNCVTYSPSLAVLSHVLQRRQRASVVPLSRPKKPVAVFGNPTEDLPHADQEARLVAAHLGCTATLGPAVTRDRLLAALAETEWFVYTGHGRLVADDGFHSRLELADGQCVSAAEICALPRAAPVVILSACETGISERRAGDELVGMVRAFLLAGTGTVIASQWRVNDAATGYLLQAFCEAIASGVSGPAVALQQATAIMRCKAEWSHFYYWGGFVVYGGW